MAHGSLLQSNSFLSACKNVQPQFSRTGRVWRIYQLREECSSCSPAGGMRVIESGNGKRKRRQNPTEHAKDEKDAKAQRKAGLCNVREQTEPLASRGKGWERKNH